MAKIKKPPAPPWEPTVAEYLEDLQLRRSENTWKNYEGDLVDFARFYGRINEVPLVNEPDKEPVPLATVAHVTAADLLRWQHDLASRPGRFRKDKPRGDTMPATINRKLAALHSFLKWAAAKDYVPGAADRPDMAERQELAPRWLDDKEQHRLIKALEMKNDKPHQGLILFDLHSGLRCAELAALLWSDITLTPGERKGKVVIRHGKGDKLRINPLGFEARRALELLGSREKISTSDPVFQSRRGPLSERGIRFIVESYGDLARLPDLTTHVLRHTFAKNFLKDGGTLEQLARLLGHKDLNTTRIYVEASLQELQDVVEGMGRRQTRPARDRGRT